MSNKPKIAAFVPMKLNNERLPGKNTKSFKGGQPLLTYIFASLCKARGIDEIYAYCSSESVKQYLPQNVKFLKRSETLDLRTTPIIDVLKTFANDVDADIYVLAHATAPFIKPATIETAIDKVVNEEYDSAFTVKPVREFLWIDGQALYNTAKIPRTQDIGNIYAETTGLYVYTKKLIEDGRRIGVNPFGVEVDFTEAVDINDPIDFDVAQAVFDKFIKPNE